MVQFPKLHVIHVEDDVLFVVFDEVLPDKYIIDNSWSNIIFVLLGFGLLFQVLSDFSVQFTDLHIYFLILKFNNCQLIDKKNIFWI